MSVQVYCSDLANGGVQIRFGENKVPSVFISRAASFGHKDCRRFVREGETRWTLSRGAYESLFKEFSGKWTFIFDSVSNKVSLKKDPYDVLFLKKDAPKEVVDSCYVALMKIYHPDIGGDVDLAQEISEARDLVYKSRGWS